MKVIDTPRTGKIGNQVAYISRYGQCYHAYVVPRNPRTDAQFRARRSFGSSSRGWGVTLTESQRERWVAAALNAPSHPWLGQYGHLSGQQFCVKINSTLRCVGQAPVAEPPDPVVFSPSPVGQLTIVNDDEGGIRLLLTVGAVTEDIMVYGQAPCSRGRTKPRRVCYLGLLPPAAGGQCDITAQYTARFGQPAPGQKVFVVTCQHKNGWKGKDQVTSASVPPRSLPGDQLTSPVPQAPQADAFGPTHPVAAGILPAVEPGILPGGMGLVAAGGAAPGGRMPPSPAGRMPAATAHDPGTAKMRSPKAAPAAIPDSQQAPSEPLSPSLRAVYKGCTPDVPGMHTLMARVHPVSISCASLVHTSRVAMGRLDGLLRAGTWEPAGWPVDCLSPGLGKAGFWVCRRDDYENG
jgi:hypothetical protein